MTQLDQRIRPLYEAGVGCRRIAAALDENPATVLKRVRRMGIARSVEQSRATAPTFTIPFAAKTHDHHLRAASIGDAVRWFLERGYTASVPLSPARYDLVVDSDDGLKRIQVKTTTTKDHGRWLVHTGRTRYVAGAPTVNAAGRRRRAAYAPNDFDFFFILVNDGTRYLIPLAAIRGALRLVLDRKYVHYRL